jgi:ankyrin repeat protein
MTVSDDIYEKCADLVRSEQYAEAKIVSEMSGFDPARVRRLLEDYKPMAEARLHTVPFWHADPIAAEIGIRVLIELAGANPQCKNANGWEPLHTAAEYAPLSCISYLVETCRVNVNAHDQDGRRPLRLAAERGDVDVVHYLCKHGAQVELADLEGRRPIHKAAKTGRLEVVKYLIEKGKANFEAGDADNERPLHKAARYGQIDMVRYLVEEKKADVEAEDKNGRRPLHHAAQSVVKDNVVYKYLLEVGKANPDARDKEGKTPVELKKAWKPESRLLRASADPQKLQKRLYQDPASADVRRVEIGEATGGGEFDFESKVLSRTHNNAAGAAARPAQERIPEETAGGQKKGGFLRPITAGIKRMFTGVNSGKN